MATYTTNYNLTKPELSDIISPVVFANNFETIDAVLAGRSGTGTLTVAGWTGASSPYTQAVACTGITADDRPVLNDVTGTDMTAGAAIDAAWLLAVGSGVNPQTSAGYITFYASAKPAVAIPFTWEVR